MAIGHDRASLQEVVVITGASAGVGRATALAFARSGAKIAILARASPGLRDAAADVVARGGMALAVDVDVADVEAVDAAADRIERELGPIAVWVNNAMVSVFSPVTEMKPEEYRRVTDVTYLGYVWGTLAALRRMRARGRGTIVQVSSALAFRSIPLQSAYCAAKHAIKGFTESLRSELIHDGSPIHVTMVHLPAVNTPQFDWVRSRLSQRPQPVPPIFQPEVAARAVVWAAHHQRRDLWVGWPTFKAIVGNRIVPGLLDRYLASRGYDGQQTRERAVPERADNLWSSAVGLHAAHGRFDARAQGASVYLWLTTHRWIVTIAALLVTALTAIAWLTT
jgi:NAD(P)-dependent dehydrogenase (short-subunit alcohol dehydrogenase family)